MGGPGFALGVSQGLQAGQDRFMQMQELKMNQELMKHRQKQMETEDQLKQIQLQSLMRKMQFEQNLPGQLGGMLGYDTGGAALGPGQQGPASSQGFDLPGLQQLLLAAPDEATAQRTLQLARLLDTTGTVRQFEESSGPTQVLNLGNGKVAIINPEPVQAKSGKPDARAQTQPDAGIDMFPEEAADRQREQQRPLGQEEQLAKQAQAQMPPLGGEPIQAKAGTAPQQSAPKPRQQEASIGGFRVKTLDLGDEKGEKVTDSLPNRISLQLHGKGILELPRDTPEGRAQIAQVNEVAEKVLQAREQAKTDASIGAITERIIKQELAKLKVDQSIKPLDEDARLWLNTHGESAPPTFTKEQAKEAGYTPVTKQDIEAVTNAKSALLQIQEYRSLAGKLLVSLEKKGHSTSSIFGMVNQFADIKTNQARIAFLDAMGDPDARALTGLFGGIAVMARATGDTANVAVAEREFLKNFAFTAGDSLESATAKLNQAERIFRGVVQNRNVPMSPNPDIPEANPGKGVKLSGKEQPIVKKIEAAPIYAQKMITAAYHDWQDGKIQDEEFLNAMKLVVSPEEAAELLRFKKERRLAGLEGANGKKR